MTQATTEWGYLYLRVTKKVCPYAAECEVVPLWRREISSMSQIFANLSYDFIIQDRK